MLLTVDLDGKHITTIEGLRDPVTGKLDPVQQAFIDHYAFQCGFCTPGIIMTTTREKITEALGGNYCRCISHYHVIEAVESLAGKVGA